jgi:adenylate cyclase
MLTKIISSYQKQFPLIVVCILIISLFLLEKMNVYNLAALAKVENILYDARVIMTMPGGIDERIVIVDIDEKSLAEIGRWPWSRIHVAKLVDKLFASYDVSLVGFDMVFPEPDESSGLKILQELGNNQLADIKEYLDAVTEMEDQLDYDKLLSKSIEDHPVVLGYYFNDAISSTGSTITGELPKPAFHRDTFNNKNVQARKANGYNANIKKLQDAALTAGHFSPWIDNDGVIRRIPMVYEYQDNYYESLSLVMVRILLGIEETKPVFADDYDTDYPALEKLSLEYLDIPVDKNLQAIVPYRGKERSFPYVSATDVIHGRIDKKILQDAIVLVGTTAPGLFDLRTTPVQKQYAGVEIHANLIAGILDQNIKQSPAYVDGIEFIQLLLIGCLLTLLLPLLSPVWAAFATLIVSMITIAFNIMLWQYANLVLPLAAILILIFMIFIANMIYGFFIERRGKLQIASIFGQYIPPDLIDEMNFNPGSYTLEAENREMTVLFSDIRGFTTISEGLTPAQLSELMNAYLTPMTKIIHENRGTIDKYIGDAVMAFWGAPLENPQHARHALKASMDMLERLNALRLEFIERGWPEINIGVGLHTGMMSVGNMGSEFRLSYTVLGDAVNLGSRLEGLTKNYGVEIIVSETTKAAVPEFVYRELDIVKVKGKDKPIGIYEPVALEEEITDEELTELDLSANAIMAYRNQEWLSAQNLFQELCGSAPNRKLYSIYLERIDDFIKYPPPTDWDGVFVHTTK